MPLSTTVRFLAVVSLLIATFPSLATEPVLAILDPEQSNRVPLLEAKLAAEPGLTLVDRAATDRVLKEQRLQAAFGPQGIGERVRLGTVLKADLLVLVRPVAGAKEPTLEVVVSETAGGLRLFVHALPVTKDADADVASFVDAVRLGLRKHREQVKEIMAVPPFVSQNLTYEFDHLKGAFAKLAEQSALSRPGTVVVELAEAEALAKELALAAPGRTLERPLPLYLLGEFKHERVEGKPVIVLALRAERGGKVVVKPERLQIAADAAATAVREWASRSVGIDAAPAAFDPRREAKQLAARARDFKRLSNWDEFLDLVEASLLLDPDQLELRSEAAHVAMTVKSRGFVNLYAHIKSGTLPVPERLKAATLRTLQAHARARDHVEWLIAHATADQSRFVFDAVNGWSASRVVIKPSMPTNRLDAEMKELVRQSYEENRRRLLPLTGQVLRTFTGAGGAWANGLMEGLTAEEGFALLERIILQYPDTVIGRRGAMNSMSVNRFGAVISYTGPEYTAFLDRMSQAPQEWIRTSAKDQELVLEARRAAIPTPGPEQEVSMQSGQVKLTRVDPPITSGDALKYGFFEMAAAGPGIDVFWSVASVYVMKEKGTVKHVLPDRTGRTNLREGKFDGRYLWFIAGSLDKPDSLLIFDPVTEKFQTVTFPGEIVPAQGSMKLMVVPYAPGKACVLGTFTRNWIALVSADQDFANPTVKVLLEARTAQDRNNGKQYLSTDVTFAPGYMIAVRDHRPGASPESLRILIERRMETAGGGTQNSGVGSHNLAVDPFHERVEVIKSPFPRLFSWSFCDTPKGLYFLNQGVPSSDREVHLVRMRALGEVEVLLRGQPQGVGTSLHAIGDRLYIIRVVEKDAPPKVEPLRPVLTPRISQWYSVNTDGSDYRQIASELPKLSRVWRSSHYGLLVRPGPEPIGTKSRLFSVEMGESK